MTGRPLNPDEAQLWARVMASVRPIRAVPVRPLTAAMPIAGTDAVSARKIKPTKGIRLPHQPAPTPAAPGRGVQRSLPAANTLDGGWDKRLLRGAVSPDTSIDLHGHTLASAHAILDVGLGRAIARGDRVLLLVTGKPPRPESERPHARGAIRAAVIDWLSISRHAGGIVAVRGAHPRHGGAGALYIILRRGRDTLA
jgi:DNA-nicking Smr family endonuclease